ncbi:MAG: response regulator transcription factor [Myxococcota bacterium]
MNILIVEDDVRTAELLEELLAMEPHHVVCVPTGEEGLAHLRSAPVDLVVLDVMLPGRDGYSICAEIRSFSSVRILMLSARGAPEDRVDGLRLGADDYLPKPFHAQELLARIEALSRRSPVAETESAGPVARARGLRLDGNARTVHLDDAEIPLTGAEFDILRALVERAGRVVSRERLMELARGTEFTAFDRAIDVHISNIRKKLGETPGAPRWIRTVRGIGYQVNVLRDEP